MTKNMRAKILFLCSIAVTSLVVLLSFQNCGTRLQHLDLASSQPEQLAQAGIVKSYLPDSNEPNFIVGDMAFSSRQMENQLGSINSLTMADTTAADTVWPLKTLGFQTDSRARSLYTASELSVLMGSIMEACNRWKSVSGITCLNLDQQAIPAGVSRVWIRHETFVDSTTQQEKLYCQGSTYTSCATVGRNSLGSDGVTRYGWISVRRGHWGNMHVITHEVGHLIGLNHEHQRFDRDQYVSPNPLARVPAGPALSYDPAQPFDFGSIMFYSASFFGSARALAGDDTLLILPEFIEANLRQVRRIPANGPNGYVVMSEAPYYFASTNPSKGDALNVSRIYGAPELQRPSCIVNGVTFPHGTSHGFYFSRIPTTAGEICRQEFRVCNAGTATGQATELTCELKCQFSDTAVSERSKFILGQTRPGYSVSTSAPGQPCPAPVNITCDLENATNGRKLAYFSSCSQTSAPTPVNGVCGASNNLCSAGTLTDSADTSSHYAWSCVGTSGGTTASCSLAKTPPPPAAVNGVCGATVNSCTAGNINDLADTSLLNVWSCVGTSGGTTANCSSAKTPPPPPSTPISCQSSGGAVINGFCHFGNSCLTQSEVSSNFLAVKNTYTSCATAVAVSHVDCVNAYGSARGYVAKCALLQASEVQSYPVATLAQRINGLYQRLRLRNPDVEGFNYWVTAITNGTQSEQALENMLAAPTPTPVNGTCGSQNNSCVSGSASDLPDYPTIYVWSCVGTSGGTTANCNVAKPTPPPTLQCPTLSFAMTSSANILNKVANCNLTLQASYHNSEYPNLYFGFEGSPSGYISANCGANGAWSNFSKTCDAPPLTALESKVINIYKELMNRTDAQITADVAGVEYWVARINDGMTESQVREHFMSTNEYYVRQLYLSSLHRSGDWEGIQNHTNRLNSFMVTREQLRIEFDNICASHINNECAGISTPTPTPTPTPVSGVCGSSLNTCSAGTLSDLADTSSHYAWSCIGSSGGVTANCSSAKPPPPPAPVTYTCGLAAGAGSNCIYFSDHSFTGGIYTCSNGAQIMVHLNGSTCRSQYVFSTAPVHNQVYSYQLGDAEPRPK